MAEIVGFTPDSPSIVGFTPDDTPQFGAGLQKRMAEYQGMSPEQAVGKARGELGQTLKGMAETAASAINPVQLARQIGQAPEAISNIAKAIPNIPRYYYENPDVLARDVAAAATPLGFETEPFRAAKAVEGVTPELRPTARQMKSEAGAAMQTAKDETPPVPAEKVKPLINRIETGIYNTYNPEAHKSITGILGKLNRLVSPEARQGFVPGLQKSIDALGDLRKYSPAARAKIEAAIGSTAPTTVSVKNLHDIQQSLKDAYNSRFENEKASASIIKNHIDDFVENEMGAPGWTADKRKYALTSTALEIKGLVDRALYRRTNLSAGQKAQALATEFRQWARPQLNGMPNKRMRMLRGLNPDAADKLETFAKGQLPFDQLLKVLGTAAPSSLMNVGLAEVAGHLLHGIVGSTLGPTGIMAVGAGARYLRGLRAEAHIDDIINTLLDDAQFGDKLGAFEQKVSPQVADAVSKTPAGNRALRAWAKKATPASARVLALMIARTVKRPDLAPRIQQELENMDQDNNGRPTSLTPAVNPAQ